MKYEWKTQEKQWYGAKKTPEILTIPPQSFIMIKGEGNPNDADFSHRVGALYSLAHPIKMGYKAYHRKNPQLQAENSYGEYGIFPLEGLWTSTDADNPLDKDKFQYTIMIRYPEFIPQEMLNELLEEVKQKKTEPLLKEVYCDQMEEGLCVQALHKGSFDDELETFDKMDAFIQAQGYQRLNAYHREIYLNDARKTAPEKRSTILRYQIKM